MRKLFKYSGCKTKLLEFYRKPPLRITRVVEPYLGSGAYILSTDLPGLGYETNPEIYQLWMWLKKTTPSELRDLNDLFVSEMAKKEKPDVRDFGLDVGPQAYIRINAASLVTGQLKSWKLYSQHKLPIEQTIACLPRLQDIEVVNASANTYVHRDDDLLFIDPPYVGTDGGYFGKSNKLSDVMGYKTSHTEALINSTSNPIIFTYGDGAQEHFSKHSWEVVKVAKVPNMRSGGTIDRTEWVSYINW